METDEFPWPNFSYIFSFKSIKGNNMITWKLCYLKLIFVFQSSISSLQKHVQASQLSVVLNICTVIAAIGKTQDNV